MYAASSITVNSFDNEKQGALIKMAITQNFLFPNPEAGLKTPATKDQNPIAQTDLSERQSNKKLFMAEISSLLSLSHL